MATRKTFSEEQKRNAVTYCKEQGHTIKQTADKFKASTASIATWINQYWKGAARGTTRIASRVQGPALFQSAPAVPSIEPMRLINVLVERLAQFEQDPTKRSVLKLLRKRPEHLGLLEDLYFEEQQAPAVQRQHEMVATDQPDGTAPSDSADHDDQRAAIIESRTDAQNSRAPNTQAGRKTLPGKAGRGANQNGGLTRVDMIAAVLKRHPHRSVRELIALLNKEYRWKTTESAVTGHLYTHRDKFLHTPPDRAANRPVTWSSK